MTRIIGRLREKALITKCLNDNQSHFAVLYGRRRVGKTFLIRSYFENTFDFYVSGLANADTKTQLIAFHIQLINYVGSDNNELPPDSWLEAFQRLIRLLEKSTSKKKVIFLDELPWMDTPRSGFVSALEYFWNSWASARNDILLLGCGSAASWMIDKLIKAKGGLHNRVTQSIKMQPFTLREVELFLSNKGYQVDRYQIVQLYMALGGIPYYLEQIDTGYSVSQNIERLCFADGATMKDEYSILFHSLFRKAENHMSIVQLLASSKNGLTRDEIIKKSNFTNGGGLTQLLQELELSSFIRSYRHYGKKSRETTYQLLDSYTLFFHRFIKNTTDTSNAWINMLHTPNYYNWAGNAFEIVILQHVNQLKQKLGISGVQVELSSFQNEKTQIDLILDRKDGIINLIEAKFSIDEFEISKSYDQNLRTKLSEFIAYSKTRKAIWITLVTTYGLKSNKYSGAVQQVLSMDDLFVESLEN